MPKRKELINLNRHNKNIKIDNYAIKPIFIIGVPRSGSTLIEKVIASGSQYIPIGEETGIIDAVVENDQLNRIGYGKGYYDRILKKINKIKKKTIFLGIAYSFQKCSRIPVNKYDFKLDYIFTNQGIIS